MRLARVTVGEEYGTHFPKSLIPGKRVWTWAMRQHKTASLQQIPSLGCVLPHSKPKLYANKRSQVMGTCFQLYSHPFSLRGSIDPSTCPTVKATSSAHMRPKTQRHCNCLCFAIWGSCPRTFICEGANVQMAHVITFTITIESMFPFTIKIWEPLSARNPLKNPSK